MSITDLVKRLASDRRRWRYFLIGAFALPIVLVLPHARSLIVRNAVATAYLHELRAPVAGVVTSVGLYPGQLANDSAGAITVHNNRLDRGQVARLEVALEGYEVEDERRMGMSSVTR